MLLSRAHAVAFFSKNLKPRPADARGPPAGVSVQFVDQVCSFSYITTHPRRTCRAAAGGCRRGGAAQRGKEGAGREELQKRCLRGLTTYTCACAAGSRLAQRRRRRRAQFVCRPRSLSRRLWKTAAHADGAVRNGSTNVRLASRDTRGGLRACCSRAARRRGERPVSATG